MEDENLIVKKLIARRSIIHTHAPLPGVYRKEKERATNITNAFLSAPALLTDRDQVCAIAPLFCMRGAGGVAVRGSRLGEDKGVTGGLCRPKEGEGVSGANATLLPVTLCIFRCPTYRSKLLAK